MRLVTILALASLGAFFALALRALSGGGKSQRTIRSDRKKEIVVPKEAQPTVQPDLSDQTEVSIPVTHKPPAIPTEDDTRTENSLDAPHAEQQEPALAPDIDKQIQSGANEGLDGGDDQLPDGHRGVSPGNRGGRPRTAAPEGEGEKAVRSRWRFQKPEIVCWNKSREWILAVELPYELEEAHGISVSQGSENLTEDEFERGYWRLAKTRGEIAVQVVENGEVCEVKRAFGDGDHLLFKLSGADLDRGRCVKQPSSGSYLVIVPEDWERCQELAGTAPATPELVCLEGFRAHFFDLLGDSATKKIAFRDRSGRAIEIGSTEPRFELVGQEVHDAGENVGPLFGGRPPSFSMTNGSWKDVGIIVLGEEGGGRRRWRTIFKPNPDLATQQVPEEIADRKAGWYFGRFYNVEDELIDSVDFRFAAGLRGITIQKSDVLPSATGHQATTVEFHHHADWDIAEFNASPREMNVERIVDKAILTVPPTQDYDRTQWLLGLRGGPQVELSILVERIWWGISDQHTRPPQWTDKQLVVTREELRATSTIALWLRLPKQRWSDSVLVGFSQATARRYRTLTTESTVAIPLRDFGDVPEMDTVGEFSLHLWVSHQETMYETSVCKLVVRAGCIFDDFSAATEDEILQHVRTHHLHELVRVLTWEEHRQRMPDLPAVIYRCGYCPAYVTASNAAYPTNAIIHHIEDDCPGAIGIPHPVPIRFRIVHDTEEIRQNVIDNLPRIHRCKFCDGEFEDFDEGDLWRHLVERHKSRFLDLR